MIVPLHPGALACAVRSGTANCRVGRIDDFRIAIQAPERNRALQVVDYLRARADFPCHTSHSGRHRSRGRTSRRVDLVDRAARMCCGNPSGVDEQLGLLPGAEDDREFRRRASASGAGIVRLYIRSRVHGNGVFAKSDQGARPAGPNRSCSADTGRSVIPQPGCYSPLQGGCVPACSAG